MKSYQIQIKSYEIHMKSYQIHMKLSWTPHFHWSNFPSSGFGDIAQHTAQLCRALGLRVVAWRNRRNLPGNDLADLVTYASDGPNAKKEMEMGEMDRICI